MGRRTKITQTSLTAASGVSKQAISQSNRVVKDSDGKIDSEATARLLSEAEKVGLRRVTALAGLKEIELEEKLSRIVPVSEVDAAWAVHTRRLKVIGAFPSRVAPLIAEVDDEAEVREVLAREVEQLLTSLSAEIRAGGGAYEPRPTGARKTGKSRGKHARS